MGLALAVVLVFAAAGGVGYAKGAEKLFAELKEGQSVRVAFTRQGCFGGNETHEYEFRRTPALTVTIAQMEAQWDNAKKEYVATGRTELGTVNVSDDEAAGLDRLLQFYRGTKQYGCTMVDYISMILRDGEKVLSTESFVDATCRTHYIEGLTFFSDLTDKLLGKPKRKVWPDPILEREKDKKKAMAFCQQFAGYDHFTKSFKITDASLGHINSMPESLFVQIEAMQPALIDAVWWWNPPSDGKPSLNWNDFIKAYAAAEAAMAKYPWLRDWKKLPGRSLELHLLGKAIGEDSDKLENYVMPPWRRAGLLGKPTYSFLARRNSGRDWVTIHLGDKDARALIVSNSKPDPESPSAMERADVYWHPRGKAGEKYSRYAILEKDGSCRVETFVVGDAK